jgi:HD-GYP domain-containing protein (c-di-GMP phosphodiesterase class II)
MLAKPRFSDKGLIELFSKVEKCEVLVAVHQVCEVLTNLMESKDLYTKNHSEEVAVISYMIALAMELPCKVADMIHIAGHLHDIGKFAIPDEILKKPGPLSKEEWELVKAHPVIGAKYIENIKIFRGKGGVIEMVLHHHERWDGKGYPDGLKGENIPLGARIIAIADAFSAMTGRRPYRKSLSFEQALEELKKEAGSQFDPFIVGAFLKVADKMLPEIKTYLKEDVKDAKTFGNKGGTESKSAIC